MAANIQRKMTIIALTSLMAGAALTPRPAPAAQSSAAGPELEEVIVTANRREESLQKAAVAIDAATGAKLADAGITDASQLNKLVPALNIRAGGGNSSSLYMRGVGNVTNNAYLDAAIAVTYDGIFLGRTGVTGSSFYDLERVEVLKGPQGILYGRNATGGAVNILPARPQLGAYSGYAQVGFGSFSEASVQGALNVPVGDNQALRIAVNRYKHDGYNKSGTNDADTTGARLQYLVQGSDAVSMRFGLDYTKLGGVGTGTSYDGAYTGRSVSAPNPWAQTVYTFVPSNLPVDEGLETAAANAYRGTQLAPPAFAFLTPITEKPYSDYKYTGLDAEVTVKSAIGTWTFIPAWRKTEGGSKFDGPAFNLGWFQDKAIQKSLEARLASPEDGRKLDYLVGAFYYKEDTDSNNTFNQEVVLPLQLYTHTAQSNAAFGQLTFHASDKLRLVAGARYTRDKKEINGAIDNFITFCGPASPPPVAPPASFGLGCAIPGRLPLFPTLDTPADALQWLISNGYIASTSTISAAPVQFYNLLNGVGRVQRVHSEVVDSVSNSRVTWKASVQYDVAPDSLLYATYETGYRSGGLQLAAGHTRYKPEFLDAASVGSKNRFHDGRVQLNIEAFYWKYKDQQVNYFTFDVGTGTLISSTENVGNSTIKGVDVDLLMAAGRHTQLSARMQYLDATYGEFHRQTAAPRDVYGCPQTQVFSSTGAPIIVGGAYVVDVNCSGMPAALSPKYSVNLGIDQTIPAGRFEFVASLYSTWRDDQWGAVDYVPHQFIKAYSVTDAGLTVQPAGGGNWYASLYARNLEDKRRTIASQSVPQNIATSSYGPPATYGLRLQRKF